MLTKTLIRGVFFMMALSFLVQEAFAQEVIKMAVFPRKPILVTKKQYEPVAQYLSSKIGKKVELVIFKDFPTFWKGLEKKEYQLVHFNQYHYIKSHKELGYNVIVKNEEFGSSMINSAIVVRTDSGINSIADLKDKKIVFGGGKKAMQSYIGAKFILRSNHLLENDYEQGFAINPPNAIFSVFNRMADAGGIGEVVLKLPVVKKRIDTGKIKVLARGEDLPMLCWAVSEKLDSEIAKKIQDTMVDMENNERGRELLKGASVTAYVATEDSEYDIVRRVVKKALDEEY